VFDIALESAFDFLSEEYRDLFQSAHPTPFQHPLWLDRLYARLAPSVGAEPLVITARSRDKDRLELVLPLVRRRHRGLRLVEFADLEVSDYAWPVCTQAVLSALAEAPRTRRRIRDLLNPYDLIRIKKAPDRAPPLERLFASGRRRGMDVRTHSARLSACFPSWQAAAMSASYVKQLQRKRRGLEREGPVAYERLNEPQMIGEALSRAREWRSARFADDKLLDDQYFAFYQEIATANADNGFSRTYRLAVNGETVAVIWGLYDRGVFLMLISAFDPRESYARRSIGALAFEDLARDCIAAGDHELDFTIGDEPYKQQFGARPSPLWAISAAGTPLGFIADMVSARRPLTTAPEGGRETESYEEGGRAPAGAA
jgi:CelD/BcsL family acetyltransferase involved in cellulose biosynthesis